MLPHLEYGTSPWIPSLLVDTILVEVRAHSGLFNK